MVLEGKISLQRCLPTDFEGKINGSGRLGEASQRKDVYTRAEELGDILLRDPTAGFHHHPGVGGFQRAGGGMQVLENKGQGYKGGGWETPRPTW